MPLTKSPSKKAFKHNIEAEMSAGKPMDQSLAIAYDVKRRNKRKKMAEGGKVDESAKTEHRPMPEERDQDSKMVVKNSGKKPASHDSWTDNVTVAQAQKPSKTALKRPALKGSDAFSVRYKDEIDEDLKRMDSMPPESPKAKMPARDEEAEPNRQGPKVHPMKMMAKGGQINKAISFLDSEEDHEEHPAGLESDNDMMGPDEDEYMANHFAEGGEVDEDDSASSMSLDKLKAGVQDLLHPSKPYDVKIYKAEGGMIGEDELEEDHEDSISAAIMAKRRREAASSGASDEPIGHYAEGGEVDLDENAIEAPNSFLRRNREILKENYDEGMDDLHQPEDSNEHGDEREMSEENEHDMVSAMRRRMKARKQF